MKPSKPPVTFSDTNAQEADAKARARAAVARAKGQSRALPSNLDLNQRFDQPVENPTPTQQTMRPETQQGLEAMFEHAKQQAANKSSAAPTESPLEIKPGKLQQFAERLLQRRNEKYDEELEVSVKEVAKDLHLPDPPSKEEAERLEWEETADLEPLSIDAYILNGFVQQTVQVIPGKLNVTFRTTVEGTEAFIESRIREVRRESGANMLISEFYRHQARFAVACQVIAYGPAKWPGLLDASSEVDPKAFEARVNLVKQIPAQIFPKVAQHLGWFNARVEALLKDPEVLGNG